MDERRGASAVGRRVTLLERARPEPDGRALADPDDASTRELLANVLADIQHALERAPEGPDAPGPGTPPEPGEHHSLAGRLREATIHLEESHPRLTFTVEELANALTSIFR